MDFVPQPALDGPSGARLTRVPLSVGSIDLLQLVGYDHDFPRHSHDHFTVGVFEVGSGSLRYRRARWSATEAAVLAVPPDEVHEAEPSKTGGWTYRTMYPTVELVAAALGSGDTHPDTFFPKPIFHDSQLSAEIMGVHTALLGEAVDLAAEESLLAMLRRLVGRHSTARTPTPLLSSARAVGIAREYLDANYARPVKLADLAAASGISPFHLIRSFRDTVGMPPHAYLTQVRATRARDLLLRGESPAGAAYLCGFCDQSHLTRIFKRLFGVTPGAYLSAAGTSARRSPSRTSRQPLP